MIRRRKKGRPLGHKLSEESKKQISRTKTGQTQTAETKEKIKISVKKYWAEKKFKEKMSRKKNKK